MKVAVPFIWRDFRWLDISVCVAIFVHFSTLPAHCLLMSSASLIRVSVKARAVFTVTERRAVSGRGSLTAFLVMVRVSHSSKWVYSLVSLLGAALALMAGQIGFRTLSKSLNVVEETKRGLLLRSATCSVQIAAGLTCGNLGASKATHERELKTYQVLWIRSSWRPAFPHS
jgi:hypothetical protein